MSFIKTQEQIRSLALLEKAGFKQTAVSLDRYITVRKQLGVFVFFGEVAPDGTVSKKPVEAFIREKSILTW